MVGLEGYLTPLLADAELRVEVTDDGLSLDGLGLELLDLRQEVSWTLATGHEGRQLQLKIWKATKKALGPLQQIKYQSMDQHVSHK